MPKVGMQPIRRQQLIDATLSAINELGFAETTIVQIAQRAGVSTGIINHYFQGKHGLIEATMRYLLKQLAESISLCLNEAEPMVEKRLQAIVKANFSALQTDRAAMKTWLDFWAVSMHSPDLQRLQKINHFRLHSNIKYEFEKKLSRDKAEWAAQGLAAMIDGFWLRGALMIEPLNIELTLQICQNYIEQQLNTA